MSNTQSIYALRNEVKKLKRMLKDSNHRNLDLQDTIARIEDSRKQLQVQLSEKTAEYGRLMMLKTNKIKNLENLVGVYEKRLDRMAERLTGLAAERNELYAEVQEYKRSWERFNKGLNQVGRGIDRD